MKNPNAQLAEGERAYRQKRYRLAAEQLTTFLDQHPESPEAQRAKYVRGMALARTGQRAAALDDLERASLAADGEIAWRARAALGVLHFEDHRWPQAGEAFDRAIDQMPPAPPMDALLYRLGLSLERSGRWSDALEAYRQITLEFPGGRYARHAHRRLQLRADSFSVQLGVFGSRRNADRLVRELRQQNVPAYVREELRDGERCFVVVAGRYNAYEDAIQALARMKGYVPRAVLWP